MFDKPYEYRKVQRNWRNLGNKNCRVIHIFKSFVRNEHCRRKIIVEVKEYSDLLFTVDFYAVIASKQRDLSDPDFSKYRFKTNVGRANRVASTIFAIMREIRREFPDLSFAFQAANLPKERFVKDNRRYRAYCSIMGLVTRAEGSVWRAFGNKENSTIFVIQERFIASKSDILKDYGNIFEITEEGEEL